MFRCAQMGELSMCDNVGQVVLFTKTINHLECDDSLSGPIPPSFNPQELEIQNIYYTAEL